MHKDVWDIIDSDVKIKKEIKDQLIKIAMDFFLTLDANIIFDDINQLMRNKKGSTQFISETLVRGDDIRLYD